MNCTRQPRRRALSTFASGAVIGLFLAALVVVAADAPKSDAPSPSVDVAGIDRGVAPGDDFFLFANGAWMNAAEIPADRSSWGASEELDEQTSKRVADLIRAAALSKAADGSIAQKVGDFFAGYLDEAAIEARGLEPLRPALDRAGAVADRKQLSRYLGGTLRADVDPLNNTDLDTDNVLGLWVAQDLDEPTRYTPFLLQGGLGLADRSYYLDPSPRMAEIRDKYLAHVTNVFELAKFSDPAARASRVFDLERKIAEAHWTREDTSDVRKTNNHWARADFDKNAPGMDWSEFFAAAGLQGQDSFGVWQPGAVTGISKLVAGGAMSTWTDYLVFHAIERHATVLPRAFDEENFAFHATVLRGVPKQRERWKRAVDHTSDALGEAVGQLYVDKFFPPAAKAKAEEMVRDLVAAFGRRIDALAWMAPETKAAARAKLGTLRVSVGYPDRFRDYSGLKVVRGDAFGNEERAELFELRRNLDKLGKPVDRGEWVMTPHVINAVNLPVMNAINFPAGILQPPFFDPAWPAAANYGAIGAVIGHEISHSFDDMGSQFDSTGRLRNWWTPQDRTRFEAAGAALVKQYDAYQPFPDLHLNGTLTLNENIADLAGLAVAYDAYRAATRDKPAPAANGFTGDQQFFLAFAQSWRDKLREAALRREVTLDGHAPAHYRVLTVRNQDAWYKAFDVSPSQKLFLPEAQRIRVW